VCSSDLHAHSNNVPETGYDLLSGFVQTVFSPHHIFSWPQAESAKGYVSVQWSSPVASPAVALMNLLHNASSNGTGPYRQDLLGETAAVHHSFPVNTPGSPQIPPVPAPDRSELVPYPRDGSVLKRVARKD